jgi:hypothetical protein
MTVIARDAVASDHLVYAWPFPLGPECEVSCADDEQVVMCPSWLVGDRLGPGRHRWRTPDPMRPVAAFFVLTSPVEIPFDLTTSFLVPTTGQPVRLRATGTIQVRCADPGLLIAQFVGLPFDNVNDGITRSVSRSVERMLARLLTRRVVMAGTPYAVTDPQMLAGIIEELVAYNPTAGAVFGVELIRMGLLLIAADDGSAPYVLMPHEAADWSGNHQRAPSPSPNGELGGGRGSQPSIPAQQAPPHDIPLLETARGTRAPSQHDAPPVQMAERVGQSGPIGPVTRGQRANSSDSFTQTSGEILIRAKKPTEPGLAIGTSPPGIPGIPKIPPLPSAVAAAPAAEDGMRSPVPGAMKIPGTPPPDSQPRGAILGIGMGHVGVGTVAGEISTKVAPGARVLVPGPNGLMQSATVRQLLQGYYELEVGSSGETIWVPMNNVVPE